MLSRFAGSVLGMVATAALAGPGDDGRWRAGAYSFSDELGGFVIRAVSGVGSAKDPIVIVEELESASPVTLVIRIEGPIRLYGPAEAAANGFLHMRIETQNNSQLGWVEFELELQEQLHVPSVFGDGLSFDQRNAEAGELSATHFRRFDRDFEPYDRLLFTDGKVDALDVAAFTFLITDFTPKRQFYLVQDPRIPSS